MRVLIYNTVKTVLGAPNPVEGRVYQTGSLGTDGIPESPKKPYVLYREGDSASHPEVSDTSNVETIPYQIWYYDEKGSFVRASAGLRLVADAIKQLAGVVSPSGKRCTGVQIGGLSQDFISPENDASVKFLTFTITGHR